MAILSLDTLSGCSSIPSFMGGSGDTPANPTKTVFYNTNAPTNWVKDTTHDNKALRVIGGANGVALSPGGSVGFISIFTSFSNPYGTSPSPAGSLSPAPIGINAENHNPFSTQPATLSSPQIASHTHTYTSAQPTAPQIAHGPGATPTAASTNSGLISGDTTTPAVHLHPVSAPHTHPITGQDHGHNFTTAGVHTHTFTVSQDLAVLYVDVIFATKS